MSAKPRHCQRCQAEIPAERVQALPQTRVCIACSQAMGGEFDVTVIPDNLGKSGSLKKNYAGWTVKKTRREIKPKEE